MVLLRWLVKIKLCFTTWQQLSAFRTTWWFRLCFTPHSEHLSYKNKLRAISVVSLLIQPSLQMTPSHTHGNSQGERLRVDAGMGFKWKLKLDVIYAIHLSVIIMILNSSPAFKRLLHFRRAWLFVIVTVLFSSKKLYIVSRRCNISLLLSKKSISI